MRILAGKKFESEKVPGSHGRVVLRCWEDYVVEGVTGEPLDVPRSCRKRELPGDTGWRVLVNFGDYVGLLRLGGQLVEIRSSKLDSAGFDELLRQIADRISNLPFDVNSPAFVPFSREAIDDRDRLYHVFMYLRWAMRFRSPLLRETWAQVSADPHRTLVREERSEAPWDARGVGPRTLEHIAAHPEVWEPLPVGSPLASTAIGRLLVGPGGARYFPREVVEIIAETCLDTPENRFAKYFMGMARELLERVLVLLRESAAFDPRFVEDAEDMLRELRVLEGAPFLREVGQMQRLPVHSQVLQKRAEYRELLTHYQALVLASRYPIDADDLTRIIETKSASLLYEYWCFFEMVEALASILGPPVSAISSSGDELHAALAEGMKVAFAGGVELHYNRSFSRSNASWRSYSVPLRPDIVLRIGETLHLFDAKFRIDRWDVPAESTAEALDAVESDDRAGVASRAWWKNADIHKMHAYKDALGKDGASVATVRVLYPGTEAVFYESEEGEGVGALPLAPGAANTQLVALLAGLI